jgi:hypothetical protein
MKYIFKQIDDISGHKSETTLEFSADSLPDILEHFEMFIRGSGFHPSGTLDFVNYDDCEEWHNEEFDTPQEEPVYTWNNTSATWPFPKSNPTEDVSKLGEEWYGVSPSTAMQWTVNELMKGPMTVQSNAEKCSVCGISFDVMANQKCWDVKCPIGNDAN